MARISGVDLPREKRVEIGLTYIYGIGVASSKRILAEANVNPDIRCKDLTDEDVSKIRDVIDRTQVVEGDLRREVALNIKRLQEIDATVEFVTERDFRFADRKLRRMLEQEKVQNVQ